MIRARRLAAWRALVRFWDRNSRLAELRPGDGHSTGGGAASHRDQGACPPLGSTRLFLEPLEERAYPGTTAFSGSESRGAR